MTDGELLAFLEWALPRRGLRFRGFRNFRGTLRKRLTRRMMELGAPNLAAYRARLGADPESSEWVTFDEMCRITISRLYRDRAIVEALRDRVLLSLAADGGSGAGAVRCWSAGCASGEEPYTLAILWAAEIQPLHPHASLAITATDVDPLLLARAKVGAYEDGSLRELPSHLRELGLVREADTRTAKGRFVVRAEHRRAISFVAHDLRRGPIAGTFHVVLCRNVAFTYFDEAMQREVLRGFASALAPKGVLVIGEHEALPDDPPGGFTPLAPGIFVRG